MVGYCLMLKDTVPTSKVLSAYFKGDYSRLFVHAKSYDKINPKIAQRRIKKQIPTAWGDISLVRAELALFEAAFADPRISRAVLLSGNCAPIRSQETVEAYLNNSRSIFFNKTRTSSIHIRRPKLKNKHRYIDWVKHRQFIMIERVVWDRCFKSDYTEDFAGMLAADEHYFGMMVARQGMFQDCNHNSLTYMKWEPPYSHPLDLERLPELSEVLPSQMFARKFVPSTQTSPEYWRRITGNVEDTPIAFNKFTNNS